MDLPVQLLAGGWTVTVRHASLVTVSGFVLVVQWGGRVGHDVGHDVLRRVWVLSCVVLEPCRACATYAQGVG